MTEQLANNAASTLSSGILVGGTSLTLNTGDGALFPANGNFRIVIGTEIIIVTARASDVLTLGTRGAEGTSAAAHSTGDAVTCVLTVAALQQAIDDQINGGKLSTTSSDNTIPPNSQLLVEEAYEIGSGDVTEISSGGLLSFVPPSGATDAPFVLLRDPTSSLIASASEVDILGAGGMMVPGGTLGVGRQMQIWVYWDMLNNSGGTLTLTEKIYFGSASASSNPLSFATSGNHKYGVSLFTIMAIGSTAQTIGGSSDLSQTSGISGAWPVAGTPTNKFSVDSTKDQLLRVTVTGAATETFLKTGMMIIVF